MSRYTSDLLFALMCAGGIILAAYLMSRPHNHGRLPMSTRLPITLIVTHSNGIRDTLTIEEPHR